MISAACRFLLLWQVLVFGGACEQEGSGKGEGGGCRAGHVKMEILCQRQTKNKKLGNGCTDVSVERLQSDPTNPAREFLLVCRLLHCWVPCTALRRCIPPCTFGVLARYTRIHTLNVKYVLYSNNFGVLVRLLLLIACR